MTFAEKLALACEVAGTFAPMDRTAQITIERYPHVEADGWKQGEIAYEASAGYVSMPEGAAKAKTPESALDKLMAVLAAKVRERAERAERDSVENAEHAGRLRRVAALMEGSK